MAAHPATLVTLGELGAPPTLLTLFGLAMTGLLLAWRVRGAILLGIGATLLAGLAATRLFALEPALVTLHGVIGAPPAPTAALGLDFAGLLRRPFGDLVLVVLTFLVLDLFDTAGTLFGVARGAGLLVDGKLPRAKGAFAADAAGTVAGALLGTSTISSYVESAAGVAAGGRTGLTAVAVGVLLLLALPFLPLVEAVGAGVVVAPGPAGVRYPVIAPVLVLVGAALLDAVRDVDWREPRDAIPAFLALVMTPLSVSITDGIACGMIAYSLLALGTRRRVPWLVHGLACLFVARYAVMA